jgi:hypothetical protein
MKPHAALLLGLAWLGSAVLGRAQDEPPTKGRLPANGSELFRALLDYAGVKPSPAGRFPDYRDKIVIVYGRPGRQDLDVVQNAARSAILKGGAVLILTDQDLDLSTGTNPFEGKFLPTGGASVFAVRATVRNQSKCFRNLPECPLVSPAPHVQLPVGGLLPAIVDQNPFDGLQHVATNKPGLLFLLQDDHRPNTFADFYRGTSAIHTVRREVAAKYDTAFSAGQILSYSSSTHSRWIALADEDVLSNSLLAAKGTDNFVFAFQLVQWLRGPEGRSECLFFEYGQLKAKFNDVEFVTVPDLPAPPIPPIPPLKMIEEQLTDFGNKVADDAQTNDRLHAALVRDEIGYGRWLRFLAIMAAGVAAVFLLRRAFAARQPGPGPAVAARDDGPPGKLLAVLRQEMVRGNNFTPAVVAYIEETFRLVGLPDGPHAQMPPVAITGKKVKKVELMHDIASLWRVAYGSSGRPVDYAAWRALEPAVEHARRLAVKGRWHFAPDFVPPGAAA